MGFIEDELSEFKKLFNNHFPNCRLVSCVRTMVRIEIKKTQFKTLIICIQFTDNYPITPILIELKSKTLSEKLLQRLTDVCEQEIKKILGKPQILNIVKFLYRFLNENPLSCCYDEINKLKELLNNNSNDELKLKQKTSSLVLRVYNYRYYLICRIVVPDNYPQSAVDIQDVQTNFSPAFHRHMVCQAKEIARRCVQPPIKKRKNQPEFQPEPSLRKPVEFLIDCVQRIPTESCQLCNKICLPADPNLLEIDENSPKHIERINCGHLFHQECLLEYMKTPPFGNKSCRKCGNRIYHFKWSLSDKLAEDRWAHEQARVRELEEVADFFK